MSDIARPDGTDAAPRRWRQTYERLSNADRTTSLDGADLERLSIASYLIGNDDESRARLESTTRRRHDDNPWVKGEG